MQVRRSDVKSAWSGIRPLASDPNASDTASASRDHVVTMDEDGMITVTGARLWCAYSPPQAGARLQLHLPDGCLVQIGLPGGIYADS